MFEYISLVLSNKLVKMRIKNANAKKFKKTHIGRGGPKLDSIKNKDANDNKGIVCRNIQFNSSIMVPVGHH